jgi:hypothetical protein
VNGHCGGPVDPRVAAAAMRPPPGGPRSSGSLRRLDNRANVRSHRRRRLGGGGRERRAPSAVRSRASTTPKARLHARPGRITRSTAGASGASVTGWRRSRLQRRQRDRPRTALRRARQRCSSPNGGPTEPPARREDRHCATRDDVSEESQSHGSTARCGCSAPRWPFKLAESLEGRVTGTTGTPPWPTTHRLQPRSDVLADRGPPLRRRRGRQHAAEGRPAFAASGAGDIPENRPLPDPFGGRTTRCRRCRPGGRAGPPPSRTARST